MDLTPYLELLGIRFREGRVTQSDSRKQGRRKDVHVRRGVPYTPQVFTPEEAGMPPRL